MQANVATDIVSGFLGSGKTTLLRHVLAHGLCDKRVAVIMNEIGEIGIDGTVITGLSAIEKMVELSSGCICCSIDEYRFDMAVQEIVDTVHPDLVIIESTGLADPEPLARRARGVGLSVDAVLTVVDATNVDRSLEETRVAGRQIEAADFLVLSKTDLLAPERVSALTTRLGRLNRRAIVVPARHGAVDLPLLFGPGVAAYRRATGAGRAQDGAAGHLQDDGIGAFVYRTSRRLRQERFERVVARLPRDVYRAKGILQFSGKDWQCLFNYTCGRSETSWVDLPGVGGETQLVIIGRNPTRYRDRVLDRLVRCETAS
jgi:cobalamin biosynthesis protein CobW